MQFHCGGIGVVLDGMVLKILLLGKEKWFKFLEFIMFGYSGLTVLENSSCRLPQIINLILMLWIGMITVN
jgi:predicted membrane channel-forming protein YqfA (hemolysin III family)